MPLYEFKCTCGTEDTFIKKMGDYDQKCPDCGKPMKKLISSKINFNFGAAGVYGYYDDNLGCYISTNRQRREEMRKQGVTEKGATPKIGGNTWV